MSHRTSAGLRTIAVFEATKGVLVMAAGFGLLVFIHENAQSVAEQIVERFHLNLARRHPRILTDALADLDNAHLRLLALAALLYSSMRFIEAYGLWRRRIWAEWFAIISGGIYLPWEIWELARGATVVKVAVFTVNVSIVVYLLARRVFSSEPGRRGPLAPQLRT